MGAVGSDNLSNKEIQQKVSKYGFCKGMSFGIYTGNLNDLKSICQTLNLNMALYKESFKSIGLSVGTHQKKGFIVCGLICELFFE
jgi:hypothetical protein